MIVTALPKSRLNSAGIQYNGKSQAENVKASPLVKMYGLTMAEVEELADSIAFLDGLCGEPEAKDKISRAHQILGRVLGSDAGFVYEQSKEAA